MVEPGKIEFRDVPTPEPGENEVLIKVKRIGVCGSDVHVYHGEHPYTSYPVVQGHEFSGEVVAVGSRVENVKPGQKVTATPQVVCGKCGPCISGNYNICNNLKVWGFQTDGCAQDYFAVEAEKVVPLPAPFSFEDGAWLEPLAVAVHAVSRCGESLEGKNVVVMGAGPIGNLVAQVARTMGTAKIAIVDLVDFRLRIAEKCGIENTIDSSQKKFSDALAEIFGGEEVDVFFECVGSEVTLNQAISHVKKGGKIVVVGVFPSKVQVDMGLVQDRELNLHGTLMYKIEDYYTGIELIEKGKVRTEPLVTKHFPFEHYLKAYQFIDDAKGKTMKIMIDL